MKKSYLATATAILLIVLAVPLAGAQEDQTAPGPDDEPACEEEGHIILPFSEVNDSLADSCMVVDPCLEATTDCPDSARLEFESQNPDSAVWTQIDDDDVRCVIGAEGAGSASVDEDPCRTTPCLDDQPCNFTAEAGPGPGEIHLSWDQPATRPDDLLGYQLTWRNFNESCESNEDGCKTFNADTMDVILGNFSDTEEDRLFPFVLDPIYRGGGGTPAVTTGEPAFHPSPPTVVATAQAETRVVTLNWTAPVDDGGVPIDYYNITRTLDGPFGKRILIASEIEAKSDQLNYTFRDDDPLMTANAHEWCVIAVNEAGLESRNYTPVPVPNTTATSEERSRNNTMSLERQGSRNAQCSVAVPNADKPTRPEAPVEDTFPPAPPEVEDPDPNDGRVKLLWSASEDLRSPDEYRIERKKIGGVWTEVQRTTETEYVSQELECETTYTYRIKARWDAGQAEVEESPWSLPGNTTPFTVAVDPPEPPTRVRAEPGDDPFEVYVGWGDTESCTQPVFKVFELVDGFKDHKATTRNHSWHGAPPEGFQDTHEYPDLTQEDCFKQRVFHVHADAVIDANPDPHEDSSMGPASPNVETTIGGCALPPANVTGHRSLSDDPTNVVIEWDAPKSWGGYGFSPASPGAYLVCDSSPEHHKDPGDHAPGGPACDPIDDPEKTSIVLEDVEGEHTFHVHARNNMSMVSPPSQDIPIGGFNPNITDVTARTISYDRDANQQLLEVTWEAQYIFERTHPETKGTPGGSEEDESAENSREYCVESRPLNESEWELEGCTSVSTPENDDGDLEQSESFTVSVGETCQEYLFRVVPSSTTESGEGSSVPASSQTWCEPQTPSEVTSDYTNGTLNLSVEWGTNATIRGGAPPSDGMASPASPREVTFYDVRLIDSEGNPQPADNIPCSVEDGRCNNATADPDFKQVRVDPCTEYRFQTRTDSPVNESPWSDMTDPILTNGTPGTYNQPPTVDVFQAGSEIEPNPDRPKEVNITGNWSNYVEGCNVADADSLELQIYKVQGELDKDPGDRPNGSSDDVDLLLGSFNRSQTIEAYDLNPTCEEEQRYYVHPELQNDSVIEPLRDGTPSTRSIVPGLDLPCPVPPPPENFTGRGGPDANQSRLDWETPDGWDEARLSYNVTMNGEERIATCVEGTEFNHTTSFAGDLNFYHVRSILDCHDASRPTSPGNNTTVQLPVYSADADIAPRSVRDLNVTHGDYHEEIRTCWKPPVKRDNTTLVVPAPDPDAYEILLYRDDGGTRGEQIDPTLYNPSSVSQEGGYDASEEICREVSVPAQPGHRHRGNLEDQAEEYWVGVVPVVDEGKDGPESTDGPVRPGGLEYRFRQQRMTPHQNTTHLALNVTEERTIHVHFNHSSGWFNASAWCRRDADVPDHASHDHESCIEQVSPGVGGLPAGKTLNLVCTFCRDHTLVIMDPRHPDNLLYGGPIEDSPIGDLLQQSPEPDETTGWYIDLQAGPALEIGYHQAGHAEGEEQGPIPGETDPLVIPP